MLGMLHHRIVDGIRRTAGKCGLVQAAEVEVVLALVERFLACREDVRPGVFEFLQKLPATEQKHAAVPEIVARREKLLGILQIRFLHKALNPMRAARRQRRAMLDIAVAGFRCVRDDAEGDQKSGGDRIHTLPDS